MGLCWGWWAVPRRCCEAVFWQGCEAAFWQGCEAAFWQGCEAAFWQDCEAAFWQDCESAFWQGCEAAFWQDCEAAFWQDCEAAFWQGGEVALWQGSETEVAIWWGWWEGFLEEHSCRRFWLFLHRRWPFFWDIFCCPSGDQIGTIWCWLLQLVPCPPAVRILGTGCCFYGGCGTGSFGGGSIRILCAISGSLFRSGMFLGTGFSGTGLPLGVVGGFGFWPCPFIPPGAWKMISAFGFPLVGVVGPVSTTVPFSRVCHWTVTLFSWPLSLMASGLQFWASARTCPLRGFFVSLRCCVGD